MPTTPLREVPKRVMDKRPFRGNSVYAETAGPLYAVYSYGPHHPIAIHDPNAGWLLNADRYSVTTAKHKSYVARGLPAKYKTTNTGVLRDVIDAKGVKPLLDRYIAEGRDTAEVMPIAALLHNP